MSNSGLSATVLGQEELQRRVNRLAKQLPKAAAAGLRAEGELIMTRSKRDYVPVDDGTLRGSGRVEGPVREGDGLYVYLSYGGAASEYAIAVHEHPSAFSPSSWQGKSVADINSVRQSRVRDEDTGRYSKMRIPWTDEPEGGRGPKFLERPVMEAAPKLLPRLAARLDLAKIAAGGGVPATGGSEE